jgi:hypothetical protein
LEEGGAAVGPGAVSGSRHDSSHWEIAFSKLAKKRARQRIAGMGRIFLYCEWGGEVSLTTHRD